MLNKISKAILLIGMLLAAIGLIVNQKEATYYLVESGLCSWQFGRLLTFFLPGFIIIPVLILSINMKGRKLALGMLFIVLFVFAFDLLNLSRQASEELIYCRPLINTFDTGLPFANSHVYLLLIALVAAGIQWGVRVQTKKTPLFIYLFFLPIFAVSLIGFPLYDTDFSAHQEKIPEKATPGLFNDFFDNQLPHEYALFVFSTGCGTCEETGRMLSTTQRGHETIPVFVLFNAIETDVEEYLKLTNLQAEYRNLSNTNDFYDVTEGRVPKVYHVKNGKIIDLREGFFINYQFFDQLIE